MKKMLAMILAAGAMLGARAETSGSCVDAAIPFAFGPSVATYPVTLTKAWLADEGRYDDSSGVLYCKSSVARGKVYTIALPVGQDFEVTCTDEAAVIEYAAAGALRYCRIDARNIASETAEVVLEIIGAPDAQTMVYVADGDLVPVDAAFEDPAESGFPGACLGRATALEFKTTVWAKTVSLVREWDEANARYLDNSVHYFRATASQDGMLTVAVPVMQAGECEVECAGRENSSCETFAGLSFCVFDANEGDEVIARLSGKRGASVTIYTYGGDYFARELVFDARGGACPMASKDVRLGRPVGALPTPKRGAFEFEGWYTAANGGVRVKPETVMSVASDVTLYAHWKAPDFSKLAVTVCSALGGDGYRLAFGGDSPWYLEGTFCCGYEGYARSGEIGNNGSSVLEMTVPGEGELSFEWSVSSEQNFDFLSFSVDGSEVDSISGEQGWAGVVHRISGAGTHVIRWIYRKDESMAGGNDCGQLRRLSWSGAKYTVTVRLDANGGYVANPVVTRGINARYDIDEPVRDGYGFLGWYTARNGGESVWEGDRVGESDKTLYAHWQRVIQGSCEGGARRFSVGNGIGQFAVTLTREWDVDEDGIGYYDDEWGVYYCKVSLKRGRVYTFAKPYDDCDFEVWGKGNWGIADYGNDGNKEYYVVDTSEMNSAEADLNICFDGDVGDHTTLYHAEGNLAPTGLSPHPEVISGALNGDEYKVSVVRSLRNRAYWFQVAVEPGINYRFLASGRKNIRIDVLASRRVTDCCGWSQGGSSIPCDVNEATGGSAEASFHVDSVRTVWIRVTADEAGDFTATAHWSEIIAPGTPVQVAFDANGGAADYAEREYTAGDTYGELPSAARTGFRLLGWFTAREGGRQVTAGTEVSLRVVTLYAHWEQLTAGSCADRAIPFAFGPSVVTYPVTLVKAWLADEERYDASSGVLYCKSSVVRGKVYTIALPVGQDFEVSCTDAGAVVEYASWGALRYCRVDARGLVSGTAEIVLMLYGRTGARTTVYVVEGDLVPADADYEAPPVGSCPGKATAFTFGTAVQARAVRLVREWDESGGRYLEGGVHYLRATAPADGQLTVAVPTALAEGCEVSCAGSATAGPEAFGGLAFWIFDAQAGDEVLVRLSGARGVDATMYAYGGDYLAKRLFFDPNGGSCPVASKEVRAGAPVGELPEPAFPLNAFQGWFTAREGGARVTAATTMVGYDVTLYAHWEAVAAGSCLEKAIAFPFGPSVAAYPVNLAKEWLADEGRYDVSSGVLYCKSSVARGKVYTIALPVGQKFDVACAAAEAIIEYATYGALRYCVINAHDLPVETAEIVLALYGGAGARTTVYVVEGDLVPADADYEAPPAGSCPGKATAFTFGSSVVARTVRLVREWDEIGGRYLDGAVHYLRATASADGRLTVAVPAAQAEGCEVSCAGSVAANPESFGGLAFWIFDAQAGDEVLVVLSGVRGSETMVYTYGGDYLPKRLLFDPNGGTCPVVSKSVRAGVPVGELPMPDDRAGYAFQGWFTAREGGARVMAATVMVDYDVTLYAHWEPRRYKVTFMSQGRVITTRTVTFMSPLGSLPVPSAPWDNTYQTYWHFHGWYYGDQFMVSSDTIMSVPSDITLTASWLAPMGI